ncbi:MAG: mevalonate kinase, partial [Candidatus Nitrosopelagicus sp.]|nr:mevalonate kinase [Candidatus Nitrosopelagicus sp.]
MKSVASAPAKIILFGEHFVVHGTKAILAAIDKRVTVTSTFTENKTIKVNSQLGTIEVPISSSHEEVKSEFRPFVYLANKILGSNQNVGGLEITINSDIPGGVGRGSSSACCVAATASISGLFNK